MSLNAANALKTSLARLSEPGPLLRLPKPYMGSKVVAPPLAKILDPDVLRIARRTIDLQFD